MMESKRAEEWSKVSKGSDSMKVRPFSTISRYGMRVRLIPHSRSLFEIIHICVYSWKPLYYSRLVLGIILTEEKREHIRYTGPVPG